MLVHVYDFSGLILLELQRFQSNVLNHQLWPAAKVIRRLLACSHSDSIRPHKTIRSGFRAATLRQIVE